MKWYKVENLEQLKELGKFREVSKKVKDDCGEIVNIKLRSWNNLYNSIINLQQLIEVLEESDNDVLNKVNTEIPINTENINNTYFNSKAAEYIFYLVELDGKERMDKLNVTRKHYSNKKIAKQWRDIIAKEIHPDVCKIKNVDKAIAKLNQLYAGMIENEK